MKAIWTRFINYFVHNNDKKTSVDYRKGRFMVSTLLFAVTVATANCIFFFLTEDDPFWLIGGAGFAIFCSIITFIYKKTGKRILCVHLINGVGCSLIAVGALFETGGLYSSDFMVILAFAAWAFLTADKLTGFIWFGFSFVLVIVFFVMHQQGKVPKVETTVGYELVNNVSSIVMLFLILLWNDKNIKADFEEISNGKKIIEEKQKEILDSIHYAKRIQQTLMPGERYIEKELKKLHK